MDELLYNLHQLMSRFNDSVHFLFTHSKYAIIITFFTHLFHSCQETTQSVLNYTPGFIK